jgi:hypothetical protein
LEEEEEERKKRKEKKTEKNNLNHEHKTKTNQVTLKDLVSNGKLELVMKDDKMMGRDVIIATYTINLLPIYSFNENANPFRGVMGNPLKKIENAAQICGSVIFRFAPFTFSLLFSSRSSYLLSFSIVP